MTARPGLAIRWRLTIWIALAFAVTLLVIFLSVWVAVSRILENDIEDDLSTSWDRVYGRAIIAGEARLAEIVQDYPFPVVIYDPSGQLIADNQFTDLEVMRPTENEIVDITIGDATIDRTVEIRGEQFRIRSRALQVPGGEVLGIAQVGTSTQTVSDIQQAMTTILIIGGAIGVFVVICVGYWLARNALRPVERMTGMAAEIEASDLTRRIDVHGQPSEVQRLADTFDGMLARLESAFGQQRNFVMDVSHELRTPLTGLRGNLDVMLMDPSLDADTRGQLESMSAEVARLVRLTSNLLYLAHAEAGREIAARPVDLDDLALEVVHQSKNVRPAVILRLEHEDQITVSGDRDLLKQLLLNLVDNAIKYSPDGSEVVISLSRTVAAVEVVVQDSGPGIPPEDAERIFERFYRISDNGSRTVGGAGIGLSISRWIARAHGGDIRVENGPGVGARFVVTLPSSAAVETVPAGRSSPGIT